MTKYELKATVLQSIRQKLIRTEETEKLKCYYVMKNEAREIIGIIHFATYVLNILTENEAEKLLTKAYNLEDRASIGIYKRGG